MTRTPVLAGTAIGDTLAILCTPATDRVTADRTDRVTADRTLADGLAFDCVRMSSTHFCHLVVAHSHYCCS